MNIKSAGIEQFLNERYATKGGYPKFLELAVIQNNKKAASEHFGVSRKQVYDWLAHVPKGAK